jgi:hypothetical protein
MLTIILDQTQDLKGIGGAWAGGGDGMGLTNLLLPQIPVITYISYFQSR